eukprot:2899047-Ditylum_brightwellii.AAC.1
MGNARLKITNFEAVHSKEVVDDFLHSYHDAKSKEECLKNAESKPSITEQIMRTLFNIVMMNKSLIWVEWGRGGKGQRWDESQAAKYSNSVLLKMAKNCIYTKLNKSKPKAVTIAMLQIELKKAEAEFYAFLGS